MNKERQSGGALRGYVVVDLTRTAAGALASMLLAEHGARVIRILDVGDRPLRDGGFVIWDRGKELARIDLAAVRSAAPGGSPPGAAQAAFVRLVESADVVIEDFAPADAGARLGDGDWLHTLNAALVHCSITAYGRQGPWRDEPPIDDLVMARLGILASMPGYRPAPVHVVHPLPSVGAAALAALGVAAALYERERTGRVRPVETSLMAGALLYHPKVTAQALAPRPFQSNPAGSAPFYSVYQCADGEWLQLGCVHARFVTTIAGVLGIAALVAEPRFGAGTAPQTEAADAELREVLTDIMRTRPYRHWAQAFEAADVPFAHARRVEESLDDPQVAHNALLVKMDDPALGALEQMGVTLTLERTPGRVPGPRAAACPPLNALPEDLPPAPGPAASTPREGVDAARQGGPLAGTRVLEITNLIAGPTAGRLLADLGADVIKLEPLTGDLSRPIGRTYFFSVNFNKRSVSVNTGAAAGKRVVERIAATCDALLANLRPGATERMGLTRERHPQLIETHLTGYGLTGPYAHRPGIDPLAQALMGLERAQGGDHNPPVFPAQLAPTDFTTGALGALGTVLALLERHRTGVIQSTSANLLGGAALLSSAWFTRFAGRTPRPLADRGHYGLDPYHRLYQTSDGWLYVAADTQSGRDALLAVMLPGVQTDAGAVEGAGLHPNDGSLASALAAAFRALPQAGCAARLAGAAVAYSPVLSGDAHEFLDHPHAAANGAVAERRHPILGAMRVASSYVRFGAGAPPSSRPTPLLGEHTHEVLLEAGLAQSEIAHLFAETVVKAQTPP